NPEAKATCADGTALDRVWESRTPPDNHSRKPPDYGQGAFVVSGPNSAVELGGCAARCLIVIADNKSFAQSAVQSDGLE
ncbi:hypothetical protein ACFVH4_30610, partial [Nocardia ignorata]|uniref:hypothetical protein n=1 Tax=Nocardia ignorata TaxID=145285 RepID=UPI003630E884